MMKLYVKKRENTICRHRFLLHRHGKNDKIRISFLVKKGQIMRNDFSVSNIKRTRRIACLITGLLLFFTVFVQSAPAAYAETPAVGDFITFGHYEQDNNPDNGKEPVEWRVLSVNGDKILVVSRYILDIAPYHNEYLPAGITWAQCSLRDFMNGDFYNAAFDEAEKKAILLTDVQNDDNPNGTPGGEDTQDYVFALSAKEISAYTAYHCIYDEEGDEYIHPDRMAYYTAYAEAKGGTKWDGYDTGFYWLRTPGEVQGDAANISCHGYGVAEDLSYTSSHYVTCATYGVRPAMVLSAAQLASPEAPGDATENPDASSQLPSDPTNGGNNPDTSTAAPTQGDKGTGKTEASWAEILNFDAATVILLLLIFIVSGLIIYWCIRQLKRR